MDEFISSDDWADYFDENLYSGEVTENDNNGPGLF